MIYLIITTCLNNKYGLQDTDHREKLYIKSITKALEYCKGTSIKPIIVENNGKRETFLDQFSLQCDVVYTENNMVPTRNKAQNELLDIKEIIEKYTILDDDTVIKLTGRYTMFSNIFFQLVLYTKFDAYLKFFNICLLKNCNDDCLLGLYAIKAKYLKTFEYEFKLSPEMEFARYVRENIGSLKEVQKLMLLYCLAENFKEVLV